MQKRIFVLAAMIISSRLMAQEQDTTSVSLDEVVMTAHKHPVKTSLTGKVVTVITRQQLERSGGKDLAQVLTEQAGIYINGANSNGGKDKSVYLRGAHYNHTLITIDGVPIYDVAGIGNSFDIRNMAIDNIERIEILKGSQSTLYGSDAVAGVINIITKRIPAKPLAFNGVLSYGSNQTYRAHGGLSGRTGIIDYNASYTYFDTKGIDETINRDNTPNKDKDGYQQNSLQASFGIQPGKGIRLRPYVRFSKIEGDLDQAVFTDELDYTFVQKSYQAGIHNEFELGKNKLTVLYNFNFIDRLYVDDSTKSRNGFDHFVRGDYQGREHFIDAYIVVPAGKRVKVTAGADYRTSHSDQEYFSIGFFGPGGSKNTKDSLKQHQVGIYGAIVINGESGFSMEVGNRISFHSEYGSNYVFNFNPSYLINRQWKIFANVSSSFRTPSLYQLFSEYGNRDLEPEKALTTEAGVQYFAPDNKLMGRATGFIRKIKDGIFFYYNPSTFQSQYINQDEQDDHGVELEATYRLPKSTLIKAFYTYVNGKISTVQNGKDTSFFNLIRRPKHSAGLNVSTQPVDRLTLGTNLRWVGEREDAYFDPQTFETVRVTLKSYFLWDLYAEYALMKNRLKIFADARNIINTKYVEVSGYSTFGFTIFGGFRLNF
jgi:vitamin B12 transporter